MSYAVWRIPSRAELGRLEKGSTECEAEAVDLPIDLWSWPLVQPYAEGSMDFGHSDGVQTATEYFIYILKKLILFIKLKTEGNNSSQSRVDQR